MSKHMLHEIIKKLSGNKNNLVVNREYVKMLGGDATCALLLGQLIYWSDGRADHNDGWVVKSYLDWTEELGLSKYQVSRAAKKLISYGLEIVCKRSNYHGGGATNHYRLDFDVLASKLSNHISVQLDSKETSLSDSQHPKLSHRKETSLSDSQHPLQSIHRLSETTTENTTTIAPVPDAIPADDMDDAIYGSSHKVTELLEYESSDTQEIRVTDSSEQKADVEKTTTDSVKEIVVLSKKQKEKSSAKKEKGKLHAPAWGSDAQVLNDAMTAMLMIAWGLNPEDRFNAGKSKGLGQYRREAKYLLSMDIHPGNLGDLWRYVKKLSVDGNWSNFTVAALRRYALEFLAQKDNPVQPARMTVSERLDPNAAHYQPPPDSPVLTDEQKQAFKDALKKPFKKKGGDAA